MPGIVHTLEVQIGFLTAGGKSQHPTPPGRVAELGHPDLFTAEY